MHTLTLGIPQPPTEMALGLYMALAALLGHRITLRHTLPAVRPHQRLTAQAAAAAAATTLVRMILLAAQAAVGRLAHT